VRELAHDPVQWQVLVLLGLKHLVLIPQCWIKIAFYSESSSTGDEKVKDSELNNIKVKVKVKLPPCSPN
jgi:hypothetical protein